MPLKGLQEIPLGIILINTPQFIFWKNVDSIYLGCNENFAIMAGLQNPQDIIGKTDYDLPWSKNFSEDYRDEDKLILQTGHPIDQKEVSLKTAQNEELVVVVSKKPLFNEEGEIIGILGIYMDITERKKMEEELRQAKIAAEAANHAKTEFIANMSHDIRTPLTGVISMARILEEAEQHPEKKQYAHWLHESGEQLLDLLNGVLDIITTGNLTEQDIHEECFNLRHNLSAISRLETPAIKTKGLDLHLQVDEAIPEYVITDRIKLHRTLLNLLGNAIKFTKTGHITISVKLLSRKAKQVKLKFSVADTGIGIASDLQNRVFDQFYRVNPAYKGLYRGHGLGLHIAQRYVALLGGKIELASEVDKGTTFSFVLSLKIGSNHDAVTKQNIEQKLSASPLLIKEEKVDNLKERQVIADGNEPHLLLVEDNFMVLKAVEMIVKQAGCRFSSAMDAEQALALMKNTRFDLILTDIGLPGISGNELARLVREWEKAAHKKPIPIVGLTAHAVSQVEKECLAAGMDYILTKPANLDNIKAILARFKIG